jgi:hypothetical protein
VHDVAVAVGCVHDREERHLQRAQRGLDILVNVRARIIFRY